MSASCVREARTRASSRSGRIRSTRSSTIRPHPEELLAGADADLGSSEETLELEKDHMRIVRCQQCDLVFVNPTFDETHYTQVYASRAYQDIVRDLA